MGILVDETKKIIAIDKVLPERPNLITIEMKYLLIEYKELAKAIENARDALKIVTEEEYLIEDDARRRAHLHGVTHTLNRAKTICLKERKLGEVELFKKFATLVQDLFERLTLYSGNIDFKAHGYETKAGCIKEYEQLVVKKAYDALLELKEDIKKEEEKAAELRKRAFKA